jgi:hypothetical protein
MKTLPIIKVKKVKSITIDLSKCPEEVRDRIREDDAYHRSKINRHWSEFDPSGKEDYSDTYTKESMEEYWKDQCKDNGFKGSLQDFIQENCLEVDQWLIESGHDFKGVKEIYFTN